MTGGMGCYVPLPFVDSGLETTLRRDIVERTLRGCLRDRLAFRGLLYPGGMLTPDGPKAFELTVRFGDPETQAYMPLLETDLLELLDGCVDGRPGDPRPRRRDTLGHDGLPLGDGVGR